MLITGNEQETQTPETKTPATSAAVADQAAPEQKKDDSFVERFAALAKKEKRILREKQEAKALKDAYEKRDTDLKKREENLKQLETLDNPLELLKMKGWTYEDVTNFILNNEKPTADHEVKGVKSEIEKLRQEMTEKEKAAETARQKQAEEEQQAAISNFKREITEFTKKNVLDYEFINLFEQQEMIYDTIAEYYEKNKKVLSVKEGADLVEKYLEDQLSKTKETKKFQKLFGIETTNTEDKKPTQSQPTQSQSKTLTNNMTPTVASTLPAKHEQERIARALAALGA